MKVESSIHSNIPPELWEQLIEKIHSSQTFILTAHESPDGDAAGTVLGLYGVLKGLGKEVTVYNDQPYPYSFQALPYAQVVSTEVPAKNSFDVSIICDCGELSRTPAGFPRSKEDHNFLIVLDHHKTSGCEGHLNLNDTNAPAAGMLIYQLQTLLKKPLTIEIAKNLYCALLSDTGGFKYQKTNPSALRAAADLLEVGVDPWEIASNLYESNPIERQKLLALALNTLELSFDGRLAFITITNDMYEKTGGTPEQTDGFVNFGRGIRGVDVAILLREQAGKWKISLRSKGEVDVSQIASSFGGGGHKNAAGSYLEGELHELKKKINDAVKLVFTKN